MDAHELLRTSFGFPAFRPGQAEALAHVLAGRDTLVVMPTGSGKSLIYQLAALLLPGTTLVISPLVALMKDQVDSLSRRSIAATFVNSTLAPAEQAARLRAMSAGQYKLVLVAPERLRNRAFQDALASVSLGLLVVDEAHCLSQWGHDFRPDYLHIASARQTFGAPHTLALTATATPRVQADIVRLLEMPDAQRLVAGFNRPNLCFEVVAAPDARAKLRLVRDFLAQADGAGIIYTGTRRDAEEVAAFVRAHAGVEAQYYHGTLDPATRTQVQDAFMAGDLPVVVATNAFGMGIDRPDVRFVLHYTMPGTLEAYYQEAGRAGRDGLPARAVLLYSPQDYALQEFFIENDAPNADELQSVHAYVKRHAADADLEAIERATGVRAIKARVALEQLETIAALSREGDQWRAGALNAHALQALVERISARREHKRALLDAMVVYAETNACRRRTILNYFGDRGEATAPLCCDNCLARDKDQAVEARPAETQSERAALIVLDTLAHLTWDIGKGKLTQILKGSAAQDMQRYTRTRNYAKFAALKVDEIESLIDQLLVAGYLKQVGGNRPTLKLTPRGEAAHRQRMAIDVQLRPVRTQTIQRSSATREAGGTVALTEQLLKQGRTPEQIAAERALSPGTIYSHLAQLIAEGRVEVDDVVPREAQAPIRAAIEALGSVQYLSPIKARLHEEVDYGVIRCVANAWAREHGHS